MNIQNMNFIIFQGETANWIPSAVYGITSFVGGILIFTIPETSDTNLPDISNYEN